MGAGALAVATISGGLMFTTAAPASAMGGCRIQVCENGKGDIVDSRAWGEDSTTAPAKLTGWKVQLNGPYQSVKSKTIIQWSATGKAQTCLAGKIPVCGYGEDFKVSGMYYRSSFIGPVAGGTGKVHWKPKCTNKHCKLKFNKSM
ncbi:hypothetical protein ACGFSD_02140 [Streptomyces caniferus]|uniref:hypothetical protein n=1 Tax=Streptomyces caniferus TaxID=285557 RepID=UPI003720DEE9